MRNFFLLFFCLTVSIASAQSPTLIWAYRMAGEMNRHANSMLVDPAGNIYMIGAFTGSLDFDPHSLNVFTLTSASGSVTDAFVLKLDPNGQFLWAVQVGGAGSDNGSCIQLDDQGNITIAGTFSGTVDFDPGPGTYNLSTNEGVFLLSLSPSGNFIRAADFETVGTQENPSISIDQLGNTYVTGSFTGQADFNPDTSASNTYFLTASNTFSDMFVVKLDNAWNFIWAFKFGGPNSGLEAIKNVKADHSGNLYMTGIYYSAAVDFDPNLGVASLPNAPGGNVFILKLDTATNFKWVRAFSGNTFTDVPWDIDIDKQGNVLTLGQFRDSLDLDPSPSGTFILTDPGNLNQVFLSKLDSLGQFVWAGAIGGAGDDFGYSLTLDASSNIYLTGHCISNSTIDLDPGAGVDTIPGGSTFIVKLDSLCQYRWGVRIGGTSANEYGASIDVDANYNVITTGLFNSTGDFDPSDSTLIIQPNSGYRLYLHKMSQCNSLPSKVVLSACDSVLFDGQYYTSSGLYSIMYQNVSGCDSLVVLDLNIRQSSAYSYAATACLSFTDPSGNTWDTTGVYTINLTNNAGCDSIVTLNLTIEEINTSVIQSGDTLWPQATSVLYIWLDCNTGNPVVFSGLPYFVPASSGNYAVVLQFGNGCVDTSSCYQVTLTGIHDSKEPAPFFLRPNPSEGLFSWNSELSFEQLEVFDIAGRKLVQRSLISSENSIDLRSLASGSYFLVATGRGNSKWYGRVDIQK